jgi:hypothetical protein
VNEKEEQSPLHIKLTLIVKCIKKIRDVVLSLTLIILLLILNFKISGIDWNARYLS